MKKLFTLSALLCAFFGFSQYYVLPNIGAGANPGGLNTDNEFPSGGGLDASWSTIMSSTASPTWSSSENIPFTFDFNGTGYTSYQVSSTGVLTFASTPGTAPSASNTSLPSTSIPSNSIMAWGLDISGSNDAVVSKTFGTAPNRQHWVFFTSASESNIGSGWTYWSIVLEETTNKIYIVDQRTATSTQSNVSLTLGIQINSSSAFEVAGSPNVGSNTANLPDPTDNSYYEIAPGTLPNRDIAGLETINQAVVKTGAPATLGGVFRNLGNQTITSADISYSVNGGATVTRKSQPPSLNMATGDRQEITSTSPWTPAADGDYTIKLWLENLNSQGDQANGNDTITYKLLASTVVPDRKVVIEEKTGTWCGWCPRGFVGMDYMDSAYHNSVITIAVHNSDPMVTTAYDNGIGSVAPGGYPGGVIDRAIPSDPNPRDLEDAYNDRMKIIPVATVDIKGVVNDKATNTMSIDVESQFIVDAANVDYRFIAVVLEDSVTGNSNGYAQVNYYSSQSQNLPLVGYGFDWQAEPNPVPASRMFYNDVARAIEPSFSGAANSVPANIAKNQMVNYSFSFTTPSNINNENMLEVAVLLVDNSNNEVINADKKKVDENAVGLDESMALLQGLQMYPSPAHTQVNIALDKKSTGSLRITDIAGKMVRSLTFTEKEMVKVNTADLLEGVYLVHMEIGGKSETRKLIIAH